MRGCGMGSVHRQQVRAAWVTRPSLLLLLAWCLEEAWAQLWCSHVEGGGGVGDVSSIGMLATSVWMRVYPLWLIVDGHMRLVESQCGDDACTIRLKKGCYVSPSLCCVASVFTRLQHNQVKCKGEGWSSNVGVDVWMFGWLAVGAGDTDFGCPEKKVAEKVRAKKLWCTNVFFFSTILSTLVLGHAQQCTA